MTMETVTEKIKTGTLYRTFDLDRATVNEDKRTVDLSFSSELPVHRWFGFEVLDHKKESVRLARLNDGGAVLVDHGGDQIGVVESAKIGTGKKGIAQIRFSKGIRAQEVFEDVKDGIRRNVSVGYQIHQMVIDKEEKGKDPTYRAIDWEPLEISIVSTPADFSIGVGREIKGNHETIVERGARQMEKAIEKETPSSVDLEKVRAEATNIAVKAESVRASEILSLGEKHKQDGLAREYIKADKSVEEFKTAVLERMKEHPPIKLPEIGMTEKETKTFSIMRAIRALSDRTYRGAGFELECSEAVAKELGRAPQGFFVPYEVQARDLTAGTGADGGFTVATEVLSGSFIDLLRNKMKVIQMGATVLGGLSGNVDIPKQSGAGTAYWVAENVDITESQPTLAQLQLTPKTVGAFTDISRRLIVQSSIGVENFVRNDLAVILALELDRVAINGSGASNQPTGILNTTGIGDEPGGANGLVPTWANIVNIWKDVAVANADFGRTGWLTNANAIAKLAQVEKAATTAQFIVPNLPSADGMTAIAGMTCGVSNQVPSNLTKGSGTNLSAIVFGNFADLIIAEWGVLDVLVDPFTGGKAGTVRIRVLKEADIGIRHAGSFSAMQDAITV